jgi:pimeloyl-ACP methyl ester carboxylesterase
MISQQLPHWFVSLMTAPGWEDAIEDFYGRELNRFSERPESYFVETSFGRTHLLAMGDPHAPPLVLLHGRCVNATIWRDFMPRLAREYRVYAPDIIGEGGKSDAIHPFTFTDGYADWLLEIFQHFRIQQASLVGMSFGGWISLKLALHAPLRVRALSLLAPAGILWATRGFLARGFMAGMMPTLNNTRQLLNFLTAEGKEITEEDHELLQLVFKHRHANAEPPVPFHDGSLRRIKAPVQIVVGEEDHVFPHKPLLERARKLLPNLYSTAVLSGVGHGIVNENPAQVLAEVCAFLDDSSAISRAS